jgi:hypothetical protein
LVQFDIAQFHGKKYIFLIIVLISSIVSFCLIVSSEQLPKNKGTIFHPGADFDVIITTDNYTKVPLATLFESQTTTFTVEIYPKVLPLVIYNLNISLYHSPVFRSKIMEFELVHNNYPKRNSTAETYISTSALSHPLVVKNYSDLFDLNIYYGRDDSDNQTYIEKIPFVWQIQTLDWSALAYLCIMPSGLVLGKLFMSRNNKSMKSNFDILIWLAVGAIIVFLIFKFSPILLSQIFNRFTYQFPVWLNQYVFGNLVTVFSLAFVWEQLFERCRKFVKHRYRSDVMNSS